LLPAKELAFAVLVILTCMGSDHMIGRYAWILTKYGRTEEQPYGATLEGVTIEREAVREQVSAFIKLLSGITQTFTIAFARPATKFATEPVFVHHTGHWPSLSAVMRTVILTLYIRCSYVDRA
jgi:hypothetical protein